MKRVFFIIVFFCFFTIPVNAADYNLYDLLNKNAVLDNQASTYVSSSTGIDFSEVSSDTNGKGLYKIGSTANDDYPILYYRGNINNNHVIFGGYCWQIIRTTSTGGIKLLYAGVPTGSTCVAEGADLAIGKSQYNDTNVAPKYGWMYGLDGESLNERNSIAKTTLDTWFEANFSDYVRELEDTIWCNDRRMENSEFYSRKRLEEGKPDLSCEVEDSFTVNPLRGNGALTYPVGIINADELTYAGEVLKKTQTETFVNIAYSYWTMTPYVVSKNMYPNSKGMLNMYTFTYSAGIRPMISLRNTTTFNFGDGTPTNPYRVDVEKQYQVLTDEYSDTEILESEANQTVSFTVVNRESDGYKFVNARIEDFNGNDLNIEIKNNQGTYSFVMVPQDVKIVTNYRIMKDFFELKTTNEKVEIPEEMVEQEQRATFMVHPDHGYGVSKLILLNDLGEELDFDITNEGNEYTFEMPGFNVTIEVEFEELPKYNVTGKSVDLGDSIFYEGDIVSFTVDKIEGKVVSRIRFIDENGEDVSIDVSEENGVYSFRMIDRDLTIFVDYVDEELINPSTHRNYFILLLIPLLFLGVKKGYLKK